MSTRAIYIVLEIINFKLLLLLLLLLFIFNKINQLTLISIYL